MIVFWDVKNCVKAFRKRVMMPHITIDMFAGRDDETKKNILEKQ